MRKPLAGSGPRKKKIEDSDLTDLDSRFIKCYPRAHSSAVTNSNEDDICWSVDLVVGRVEDIEFYPGLPYRQCTQSCPTTWGIFILFLGIAMQLRFLALASLRSLSVRCGSIVREMIGCLSLAALAESFLGERRWYLPGHMMQRGSKAARVSQLNRMRKSAPSEDWFSEFPNGKRTLSTTWPWNIKPSLAVLWGVCWMFYDNVDENVLENVGADGYDFDEYLWTSGPTASNTCQAQSLPFGGIMLTTASASDPSLRSHLAGRESTSRPAMIGRRHSHNPESSTTSHHIRRHEEDVAHSPELHELRRSLGAAEPLSTLRSSFRPHNSIATLASQDDSSSAGDGYEAAGGSLPSSHHHQYPTLSVGSDSATALKPSHYPSLSDYGRANHPISPQAASTGSQATALTHLPRRPDGRRAVPSSVISPGQARQNANAATTTSATGHHSSVSLALEPSRYTTDIYGNPMPLQFRHHPSNDHHHHPVAAQTTNLRLHQQQQHQHYQQQYPHDIQDVGYSSSPSALSSPNLSLKNQFKFLNVMREQRADSGTNLLSPVSMAEYDSSTSPTAHGGATAHASKGPPSISRTPLSASVEDKPEIYLSPTSPAASSRDEQPPRNAENKIYCNTPGCNGKTFERKCEWKKHMDKHQRPYKCDKAGCEKLQGFTYSGGLLRHEREVHKLHGGTAKSLFCPHRDCKRHSGSGFTRKENLLEHLRRVHRRSSDDGSTGDPERDEASSGYSQSPRNDESEPQLRQTIKRKWTAFAPATTSTPPSTTASDAKAQQEDTAAGPSELREQIKRLRSEMDAKNRALEALEQKVEALAKRSGG